MTDLPHRLRQLAESPLFTPSEACRLASEAASLLDRYREALERIDRWEPKTKCIGCNGVKIIAAGALADGATEKEPKP